MNSIGAGLATSFERANAEVIGFVERQSDAEWRMWCEREGRQVGVVVYHIAVGHGIIGEQIEALAQGVAPPNRGIATAEDAARFNAEQAEEHVDCTRDEVIDLLRRNGAAVAAMLCGLTDIQLQQTATVRGRTVTLQERIQRGLLGHISGHLEALREMVG